MMLKFIHILKNLFFKKSKKNISSLSDEDMVMYIENKIHHALHKGFSCIDLCFPLSKDLLNELYECNYSISVYETKDKSGCNCSDKKHEKYNSDLVKRTKICW